MNPMTPTNPRPYLFQDFPNLMAQAAWEIQGYIHAPDPMIGMAVTAAAAAVVQGLADVKMPTGQIRPTALNFLVIAESGERKTTIDNLLFAPIFAHDAELLAAYRAAIAKHTFDLRRWTVKEKSLHKKYDKAEGDPEQEAHWIEQIEAHNARMPAKPRLRRLIRQDLTGRAWMDALEGDGESIVLATDEGEVLFKGRVMQQLGRLNKAFDGAALLSLDLADDENIVVTNPRLSINIMTQREVLDDFLAKRGSIARGSGHWARYLVAWPPSTQGFRPVPDQEPVWEDLPKFHARIKELLQRWDARVASGDMTRDVLEFSEEAKHRWVGLAREAEAMIRPGGYLRDINDFASKVMEILGRMAAVFHYFNNEQGKISVDTVNRAFEFVHWHLEEFKRLFSEQNALPEDQDDALRVEDYLRHRAPLEIVHGQKQVKKNLLLNRHVVGSARRLNAALDVLERQEKVWIDRTRRNKERWVLLSPAFFP